MNKYIIAIILISILILSLITLKQKASATEKENLPLATPSGIATTPDSDIFVTVHNEVTIYPDENGCSMFAVTKDGYVCIDSIVEYELNKTKDRVISIDDVVKHIE